MKNTLAKISVAFAGLFLSHAAIAQTAPAPEVGYMLNTLLLLICGVLVMFMAAGFAMLEAGMVRSKSVAVILAKNIALYAIASIMFFLVGYELMYGESVNGLFGEFKIWHAAEVPGAPIDVATGHPSSASWFFQMVFVATAASVVSGALAERIRFWPFAVFVVILTGFLYPITGHWTWGGGWLSDRDGGHFGGCSVVGDDGE